MGYAPSNIQGEAVRMQDQKNKLQKILEYLKNNPDVEEYQDYTKESAEKAIESINEFEFLS